MKELYESRILEYSRTLNKGRSYADYLEEKIRSDKGYDCYKRELNRLKRIPKDEEI